MSETTAPAVKSEAAPGVKVTSDGGADTPSGRTSPQASSYVAPQLISVGNVHHLLANGNSPADDGNGPGAGQGG